MYFENIFVVFSCQVQVVWMEMEWPLRELHPVLQKELRQEVPVQGHQVIHSCFTLNLNLPNGDSRK